MDEQEITLFLKKRSKLTKKYYNDTTNLEMIKLCGKFIALPLRLIFQSILNDGAFSED